MMMMMMMFVTGTGIPASWSRMDYGVMIAVGWYRPRRVHRWATGRVTRFSVQRISKTIFSFTLFAIEFDFVLNCHVKIWFNALMNWINCKSENLFFASLNHCICRKKNLNASFVNCMQEKAKRATEDAIKLMQVNCPALISNPSSRFIGACNISNRSQSEPLSHM